MAKGKYTNPFMENNGKSSFDFSEAKLSGLEGSQTYKAPVSIKRILLITLSSIISIGILSMMITVIAYYQLVLKPKIPDISALKDIEYQVPLTIYTQDGLLINEVGTKKRTPLAYKDTPKPLINAIISAEDDRFFEHQGIDFMGLFRAALVLITTGEKAQGGSTITMQMARNFYLSQEKSYERKLVELFLARKIEEDLSKEEILELYMNKIFLGHRSYGFEAAAKTYYGQSLKDLNLAQIAMLAGLPKAPSAYNPIVNPDRALQRRNYVLKRMLELGHITQAAYTQAIAFKDNAKTYATKLDMDAGYAAEMAREQAVELFGSTDIYTKGYKIYTTIKSDLQKQANLSLEHGLMEYIRRQGYFQPLAKVQGPVTNDNLPLAKMNEFDEIGHLRVAIVQSTNESHAKVFLKDNRSVLIQADDLKWVKRLVDGEWRDATSPSTALNAGEIIYLEPQITRDGKTQWLLASKPTAQGALVSLDSHTGSIQAITGGFEFEHYKFNRASQAQRQPGSCFKPFIYSAALENGFTAASIINDAPVVFKDNLLEDYWKPTNFSGRFYGPTRFRYALAQSRNLVSIRLLQAIGIPTAINYAALFGFDKERLNQTRNLSLSLGASAVTPLELARAYAVFSNGGRLIDPYLIDRVEDAKGEIIYKAQPAIACETCDAPLKAPRVITPQNAFLMTNIMQDVIEYGTARKAKALGRNDLSGKTGTTNDQKDAWFSGFNNQTVTSVWVGFDTPEILGRKETGGTTALPIWMDYMAVALKDSPQAKLERPLGLVDVRIDRKTGLATSSNNPDSMFEIFRLGHEPQVEAISEESLENKTLNDLF